LLPNLSLVPIDQSVHYSISISINFFFALLFGAAEEYKNGTLGNAQAEVTRDGMLREHETREVAGWMLLLLLLRLSFHLPQPSASEFVSPSLCQSFFILPPLTK
jgi:hypothetical protein